MSGHFSHTFSFMGHVEVMEAAFLFSEATVRSRRKAKATVCSPDKMVQQQRSLFLLLMNLYYSWKHLGNKNSSVFCFFGKLFCTNQLLSEGCAVRKLFTQHSIYRQQVHSRCTGHGGNTWRKHCGWCEASTATAQPSSITNPSF